MCITFFFFNKLCHFSNLIWESDLFELFFTALCRKVRSLYELFFTAFYRLFRSLMWFVIYMLGRRHDSWWAAIKKLRQNIVANESILEMQLISSQKVQIVQMCLTYFGRAWFHWFNFKKIKIKKLKKKIYGLPNVEVNILKGYSFLNK